MWPCGQVTPQTATPLRTLLYSATGPRHLRLVQEAPRAIRGFLPCVAARRCHTINTTAERTRRLTPPRPGRLALTSPSTLPAPLRRPLVVLAGRLRRLRLLRGVSAVVLFLALGLLLLFAADHWLKLTPFQLWAGEIVLAVGSLAIIGFLVLRPLCRRADAHALAALIERRYPQLCERLTSSVALVERRDLTNGAPVLVELLFAQTADQTQGLDVSAVAPVRASLRLAAAALAALLLTTATAALSASATLYPAFMEPGRSGLLLHPGVRPGAGPPGRRCLARHRDAAALRRSGRATAANAAAADAAHRRAARRRCL